MSQRDPPNLDPAQFWAAGRELVGRAKSSAEITYEAALLFRDGLILAFATAVPVRLALLQRMMLIQDEVFCIEAPHEGQPIRVDLHHWPELAADIREYATRYRPLLLSGMITDALWISGQGTQLSRRRLAEVFRARTTQVLGIPATVGALREAVVKLFMVDAPEHIDDLAVILGYHGSAVIEQLRARAAQLAAQEKGYGIIQAETRSLVSERMSGLPRPE
jgi:hypothetical protein